MENSKPFIEVLIPTYSRPASAIKAIQSVLSTKQADVHALCQSNGFEPDIDAFARENPRCTYQYFENNQGAVVNFREILRKSRGDYVIFMSDEDEINSEYIKELIDHLKHHQPVFTFCPINNENGSPYFSISGLRVERLSSSHVAQIFPIHPTYLSGYCYRRREITDLLLDTCFENHPSNAYPHLLLRNALLTAGTVSVFAHPLINKGQEALGGGDSHEHLVQTGNKPQKAGLNPRVYGVQARAKQFTYLQDNLMSGAAFAPALTNAFVQFYLVAAWSRMTNAANDVTNENYSFSSYAAARKEIANPDRLLNRAETIYLHLITMRPPLLRRALIQLLWSLAKGGRLALLLWHFGPARTLRFLKTRSG